MIQVVGRHIGVRYKLEIYKRFLIEMMKCLRESRKGARTVDCITLQIISPAEKRILINKVVAQCHERVLQYIACKHALHATATWLLVAYLNVNKSGVTKDQYYTPEELNVKVQHLT